MISTMLRLKAYMVMSLPYRSPLMICLSKWARLSMSPAICCPMNQVSRHRRIMSEFAQHETKAGLDAGPRARTASRPDPAGQPRRSCRDPPTRYEAASDWAGAAREGGHSVATSHVIPCRTELARRGRPDEAASCTPDADAMPTVRPASNPQAHFRRARKPRIDTPALGGERWLPRPMLLYAPLSTCAGRRDGAGPPQGNRRPTMKLLRYGPPGAEKPGLLDAAGDIRCLPQWCATSTAPRCRRRAEEDRRPRSEHAAENRSRRAAGVLRRRPVNYVCIGLNYADHAAETGAAIPKEPIVFLKSLGALCGPNDNVKMPRGAKKLDWEVESASLSARPRAMCRR